MSHQVLFSDQLGAGYTDRDYRLGTALDSQASARLAAAITKAASQQSYYTIRYLADRDRVADAYRAYAYFRWVDDRVDEPAASPSERMAFIERQQALVDCGYLGEWPGDLCPEEHMLMHLIESDREPESGLQTYIRNLMAVMAFDARRRDRVISRQELTDYQYCLSTAVTAAMHHFIGHGDPTPRSEARTLLVTAAHITHMLRDALEDAAVGYFNIPYEFLEEQGIDPWEVSSGAYREWVRNRAQLARAYFRAGKGYLQQVKNRRFRMAGYAYKARFEVVLAAIERDGYRLRPEYMERKSLRGGLKIALSSLRGVV